MLSSMLATQPIWLSGTHLVGVMTALAMIAPVLVRRRVGLERRRINDEVAGFIVATVGVLDAVLLAFAVIVAWEKFSEAEGAAAKEAGSVATLDRLSQGIEGEPGATFRTALARYGRTVIAEDWPAMERGEPAAPRPGRSTGPTQPCWPSTPVMAAATPCWPRPSTSSTA